MAVADIIHQFSVQIDRMERVANETPAGSARDLMLDRASSLRGQLPDLQSYMECWLTSTRVTQGGVN